MLGYVQLLGPWYAAVAAQMDMDKCVDAVGIGAMGDNKQGRGPADKGEDGGCGRDRDGG